MLQRWRSRSESSERARQASRSAGRVGITRCASVFLCVAAEQQVSSEHWGGNQRREGQQTLGLQDQVDRVSVSTHTSPSTNSLHCQKNNLLQSKLEKSALESEIASEFSSSCRCEPLVVLPQKWRTGSRQKKKKWMVKLKRTGAADVVQLHSNQTQQRSVASLHHNWMKFQVHHGITQCFLFFQVQATTQ